MSLHRATSLFQLTNNIKRKDSMNDYVVSYFNDYGDLEHYMTSSICIDDALVTFRLEFGEQVDVKMIQLL